jgi:predicted DNA-binding protein
MSYGNVEEDAEGRCRLRILLTEEEIARLDAAVAESYAMNRSLLVFEAIQAGIKKSMINTLPSASKRREVAIWVTRELKQQVKHLAENHSVTQQRLLRHFLFQYLTNPPWKENKSM